MVLNTIARGGDVFTSMRSLLEDNHEPRPRQRDLIRQALAIYRTLQEALNNAAKHCGGCGVDVALEKREGRLRLAVHDDGSGPALYAAAGGTLVGRWDGASWAYLPYMDERISALASFDDGSGASPKRAACSE